MSAATVSSVEPRSVSDDGHRILAVGLCLRDAEHTAQLHWPVSPEVMQWGWRCQHCDSSGVLRRDSIEWSLIASWAQEQAPGHSSRARVDVTGNDLYRMVDEAWAALLAADDPRWPRVLVRGGALVRLSADGHLAELNADTLTDELSRVVDFGRIVIADDEPTWKPTMPPSNVVRGLLSRDVKDLPDARLVDEIVDTPVFLKDGSCLTEPGYHPASKLIYMPAPGMENAAPGDTSQVDVVASARELLMQDLLGDFDYADDASRSHALCLTLQHFARRLIDGATPMYTALANMPGSGKSTLIETALAPACGTVPLQPGTIDSEAEWRKNITSHLLTGPKAVVFDNVSGALKSSTLAPALTGGVWTDRGLGGNKILEMRIRNVWAATGNNLDFTEENARRLAPIILDPGERDKADVRPKSEFRHPDIKRWALDHRVELVSACLTLIQHYLDGAFILSDAGHTFVRISAPFESERHLGSFEDWGRVMGGVCVSLDVHDFLGNRHVIESESNQEQRDFAALLAAWHDAFGDEAIRVKTLAEALATNGVLNPAIPDDLIEHELYAEKLKAKLSYWLRKRRGWRTTDGQLQLVKVQLNARDDGWSVRARPASS